VLRFRSIIASTAIAMSIVTAATACAGEPERSTAAFCSRLQVNVELLEGPLSTPEELAALVDRYRELERVAPLSIEASWTLITELVETAAEVPRGDPDAVAALARQAYGTDLAARDVADWVSERCGFELPRLPGR
jgi:hypothetical protein